MNRPLPCERTAQLLCETKLKHLCNSTELYYSISLTASLVWRKFGSPQLIHFETKGLTPQLLKWRGVFHFSDFPPILRWQSSDGFPNEDTFFRVSTIPCKMNKLARKLAPADARSELTGHRARNMFQVWQPCDTYVLHHDTSRSLPWSLLSTAGSAGLLNSRRVAGAVLAVLCAALLPHDTSTPQTTPHHTRSDCTLCQPTTDVLSIQLLLQHHLQRPAVLDFAAVVRCGGFVGKTSVAACRFQQAFAITCFLLVYTSTSLLVDPSYHALTSSHTAPAH